jgi:hypothetical protein
MAWVRGRRARPNQPSITATSVWQVNWTGISAGAPVSGAETVRISAESSLAVGEVQVLVSGN